MSDKTHELTIPAAMLNRGFWLYVWRADTPKGELLYVGRTGDNSSPFATAPYQRMGQHLGYQKNQNALRRHLLSRGVEPESCRSFQLIAHGPLYPQAADMKAHKEPRDIVAAMEKALAEALQNAGYDVMNTVRCRKPLNQAVFAAVLHAFGAHFSGIKKLGALVS